MIATYPNFSKLELRHKELVSGFVNKFEPYSDFNFVSLFSWNSDNSTELSMLNGNLVIRLADYLVGDPVYSLIGDSNIDKSLTILLHDNTKLSLVPKSVVRAIVNKSDFIITEDPASFDYIYNVKHLSKVAGGKYKNKRNKSNVFIRDHDNHDLRVLNIDKMDQRHAQLIKEVSKQWAVQTPRSGGDFMAERKAIDRLLDNISEFKLITTEILVNGDIKAFSINEIINEDYAICHFEKALNYHHKNINTFLVLEAAKTINQAGCKWINWEQDLGLEGLRKSKQSYHPERMLKKYKISLK